MKRKTDNFSKFYNKKNNAAIKEAFRQEKKTAKKERKEAIDRHFEQQRKTREAAAAPKSAPSSPFAGSSSSATPHGEHLPLNKYIAHSGICSRRDAAELVRIGKVTVNGKPVTEPGTKVVPTDTVKVNGKKITMSGNFVYILLNKPKDIITTAEDPQGRRTVLDLIRQATTERVYPVGRLDRNTSGVLLLTNDGDLAQKLAHPSHEIKKVYHVVLDKALTHADFDKIASGVVLEDGPAHVDAIAYADTKDKTQIGLEIHSGRNRIVRRIFEHLGYDVRGLDRVMYAGLTKKNVQRGKWRLLTEKEVRILKYLNSSIKGSSARAKDWAATTPEPTAPTGKPAPHDRPAPRTEPTGNPAARASSPRPSSPRTASPRKPSPHPAPPRKPAGPARKRPTSARKSSTHPGSPSTASPRKPSVPLRKPTRAPKNNRPSRPD